ncbi:hypothetical protein [Parasphingopyxis lamellibrachiae]|uniref:Uncharacterized protein n=1 Tax=Parasphingopyxis lamellibrachiae TaxID=680125 RepID=A0A3D9FFU3_9SPHN|nr:hypothetical protein [Parasphingopyxis lamellibrachiae]RED16705.1 hypothetical protein DFR46_1733 [Parasphingopyxis lamellibrachiae]
MTEVAQKQLDHARKPIPFLFNWGIPILVLVSVNIVQGFWPVSIVLWMIIGSFTWMGIGCVINAARCGRLHCYFSGPIFLIGALATFLVGFEFADLGSISVSLISNVTIVLALSTFILEWVWGAYGSKRSPDPLN